MQNLVVETKRVWQAVGNICYGPTEAETNSLVFRRSIYVASDINKGDLFTSKNIRIVRPGDGAPPQLYQQLLGKNAKRAYKAGTPLSLENLL